MKAVIWCPGPSIAKDVDFYPKAYELHIAVNGAILLSQPSISCYFDYWAFGDAEVFKDCMAKIWLPRLLALNTKIWTHKNAIRQSAEHTAGWTPETRRWFGYFQAEHYERLSEIVDLGYVKFWRSYTMFCAIALAVIKGCKEIELLGADLGGQGYFEKGLENGRTDHSDKRWEKEIRFFKDAVEALEKQGIRLYRSNIGGKS